jgi:hypothetical protein
VGGVDSDEDGNGDKAERRGKNVDRDGDDLDELDVDHECEGESDNEDVDMYEEKDAPVMRFGPPKVAKGQSGSGKVKSAARHDHQDATDAILASSIDSKILFFVTVNFF